MESAGLAVVGSTPRLIPPTAIGECIVVEATTGRERRIEVTAHTRAIPRGAGATNAADTTNATHASNAIAHAAPCAGARQFTVVEARAIRHRVGAVPAVQARLTPVVQTVVPRAVVRVPVVVPVAPVVVGAPATVAPRIRRTVAAVPAPSGIATVVHVGIHGGVVAGVAVVGIIIARHRRVGAGVLVIVVGAAVGLRIVLRAAIGCGGACIAVAGAEHRGAILDVGAQIAGRVTEGHRVGRAAVHLDEGARIHRATGGNAVDRFRHLIAQRPWAVGVRRLEPRRVVAAVHRTTKLDHRLAGVGGVLHVGALNRRERGRARELHVALRGGAVQHHGVHQSAVHHRLLGGVGAGHAGHHR